MFVRAVRAGEAKLRGRARGNSPVAGPRPDQMFLPPANGGPGAGRRCPAGVPPKHIEMQIDIADRHAIEMQIEMQIDMQIEMQIYMQIDLQIDMQIDNNLHCCPLLAPSPPQPPYHPKGGRIGKPLCRQCR